FQHVPARPQPQQLQLQPKPHQSPQHSPQSSQPRRQERYTVFSSMVRKWAPSCWCPTILRRRVNSYKSVCRMVGVERVRGRRAPV
ncbi:unnamed protein product, partial [Sphagnum balticum]